MRILSSRIYMDNLHYDEIAGTSGEVESLPKTGFVSGSRFTCVDTGDLYLFDDVAGKWNGPFRLYVAAEDQRQGGS